VTQPLKKVHFCDDTGREWTVFESPVDGKHHLFFDSDEVFRRVAEYPQDWCKLTPEDLLLLSWRR